MLILWLLYQSKCFCFHFNFKIKKKKIFFIWKQRCRESRKDFLSSGRWRWHSLNGGHGQKWPGNSRSILPTWMQGLKALRPRAGSSWTQKPGTAFIGCFADISAGSCIESREARGPNLWYGIWNIGVQSCVLICTTTLTCKCRIDGCLKAYVVIACCLMSYSF